MLTYMGRSLVSLLFCMSLFFVNTDFPDADCYCNIQRKCQYNVSALVKLLRQSTRSFFE